MGKIPAEGKVWLSGPSPDSRIASHRQRFRKIPLRSPLTPLATDAHTMSGILRKRPPSNGGITTASSSCETTSCSFGHYKSLDDP